VVDNTLRSASHRDVYVIGDAAAVPGPWGELLAMGCRTGGFTGPKAADAVVARLTGGDLEPFRFRYFHECISLGRRHGLVQFLRLDGTAKRQALTGRLAVRYKNATLNGARTYFRSSGPRFSRRHIVTTLNSPTQGDIATPFAPGHGEYR
jgi:NADH:quinone reductase (non-electrogenic)